MSVTPSGDMQAFKEVLSRSKHIVAVAGAGLSAASGELIAYTLILGQADRIPGIPTFRGAGGMWRKYNASTCCAYFLELGLMVEFGQ
jgi:NAD-dependent deacetylase sirtuin 5